MIAIRENKNSNSILSDWEEGARLLHLRDLYCFTQVYESRSFSKAADSLDTVQSLVSTRIQRLEEFIGAPLFVRLHRGVVSTEKGELLYQHAKRVLRDVAELESAFRARDVA